MEKINLKKIEKVSKPRYEGLHAKIIHPHPTVLKVLDIDAKKKGMNLKVYIETLLLVQSKNIIKELEKKNKKR